MFIVNFELNILYLIQLFIDFLVFVFKNLLLSTNQQNIDATLILYRPVQSCRSDADECCRSNSRGENANHRSPIEGWTL